MANKFFTDGYSAYGVSRPVFSTQSQSAAPAAEPAAKEAPALSLEQRLMLLNIPYNEATRSVRKAISALCEHMDHLQYDLDLTRERLQDAEIQAETDSVTGLANRRAFFKKLEWAIAMHERYQHHFSIVYYDLNNLKAINDRYGHAAGDMAIRHAGRILKSAMRDTDFLARIGGDEFAMIMHYADEEAALRRGRRVAQVLVSSSFVFNGQPLMISAACGAHGIRTGDTADAALSEADKSMYADKASFHTHRAESFQA